jgi:hypothetical protein
MGVLGDYYSFDSSGYSRLETLATWSSSIHFYIPFVEETLCAKASEAKTKRFGRVRNRGLLSAD